MKLQSRSFATMSENLDHRAYAIWAHMRPILTSLILRNEDVDTHHIYSDGPTSQYRNRTDTTLWIQTLINEFKQITESSWTFSEPGHGKGPMDGVGGYLKRTADSDVLMGKDIETASDFANLFADPAVKVNVINEEDMAKAKNNAPKSLDAISDIMNITRITWQRGPEVLIQVYRYENLHKELKLSTLSSHFNGSAVEPIDVCMPSIESPNSKEPMVTDLEDLLKLKERHNSIYKTVYNSSSSDDEDSMTISVHRQTKEKCNGAEASTSYSKENIHPDMISPGTFLLIKVSTQKANNHYRYIATCQTCVDNEDGEILVTFLRPVRNSTRKFKLEINDESYVSFEQIISIISTPLLKKEQNREYYYFETDVDVFEKF